MAENDKVVVPFMGGAYANGNVAISCQESINYYLEANGQQGRSPYVLRGTPGLVAFTTGLNGAGRAIYKSGVNLFVVCGTKFYRVDVNGVATEFGTITGTNRLYMTETTNYIVIADQPIDTLQGFTVFPGRTSVGYTFHKGTNTFAQIADGDFSDVGNDGFFVSLIDNPTGYDPTHDTLVKTRNNIVVGLVIMNRQLVIFGTETVEFWRFSGASPMPFEIQEGAVIELGCLSPGSIVRGENTIFFLGKDRCLYKLTTYQPERISTVPIEEDIGSLFNSDGEFSNTRAWFHNWKGHKFYVFAASTGAGIKTWVYDLNLPPELGWHRRKSANVTYWRATLGAELNEVPYALDASLGTIWKLTEGIYTEGSDSLEAVRTGQYLHMDQNDFTLPAIEMVCQQNSASLDADPGIFLSLTKDGGNTFGTERERKFGTKNRLIWRDNGDVPQSIAIKTRISARRNRDILACSAELAR